jgi:uncharacterized protein YdhG (YjbR/CyaY superfamily)
MATVFATIPEYLAHHGPIKGQTMQTILEVITQHFPELSTKMAWNVPHVYVSKTYVFGMSAAKNHLTLNPWSTAVMTDFTPRLSGNGYVVAKTTFHVPVDWQVDHTLISALVRARLAEA